jgi:N-acetylglucosamine kinase-like BadF-type ATPase
VTGSANGTRAAVLAVDGGNSKADLALVGADGTLIAAVHGPSISHQAVGIERGMANLRELAADAAYAAGITVDNAGRPLASPLAGLGVYGLAGADYPEDVRLLERSIGGLRLTDSTVVLNDTFAALRAGTHRPWGVILICGHGINAAAIAPDGRSARFDGVGHFSGDWGGGHALGLEALAAAVRGRDGRGPRTSLERSVPAVFGLRSPAALTKALYLERIDEHRLSDLAPLAFETAREGDAAAGAIIDRLVGELVAMGRALIRRLGLGGLDPEVVLAGGVFKTDHESFFERLEAGILEAAPRASIHRLTAPPVLGTALIGLDRLAPDGATPAAVEARLRAALEAWSAR